jgi:hypothetical protein|tara:strand:- start:1387 stop:1863 length:477 start_codon:yes stop_codon:yes gene_type:complete
MNKFQYLLAFLLIFSSCEDTIEDRIPAFQAHVNGVQFWEASSFSIITDSNGTIITGNNLSGTLTMYVPSLEVSVNNLGSSEVAVGVFQDTLYYSTMYNGIASIAHLSDGEITIDEFNSEENTISGTFNFDAYNETGEYNLNISEGVFYRLPISVSSEN